MNAAQQSQLREKLEQEQRELSKRLKDNEHYGLESSMRDQISEFAMYDNHPADLGTELYERGKDISLNERDETRLNEIEEAFERMEDGSYGVCVECGREIPFDRLEAAPTAKYCIEHQPNDDESNRRPAEEDVLAPPFGKYDFDNNDDETEFDAEDAWQAVERYGTSNPPDFYREGEDYNELGIEPDERIGYTEDVEQVAITDLQGDRNDDGSIEVARNHSYERLEDEENLEDNERY